MDTHAGLGCWLRNGGLMMVCLGVHVKYWNMVGVEFLCVDCDPDDALFVVH